MDKLTNNDLQNITHKVKDRVTRTPLRTSMKKSGSIKLYIYLDIIMSDSLLIIFFVYFSRQKNRGVSTNLNTIISELFFVVVVLFCLGQFWAHYHTNITSSISDILRPLLMLVMAFDFHIPSNYNFRCCFLKHTKYMYMQLVSLL